MNDAIQWWAYRHTNGTIQLKRYFDKRDMEDAEESPFVDEYTRPFSADNREHAMEIAEGRLCSPT